MELFLQKSSIIDVGVGSKYSSEVLLLRAKEGEKTFEHLTCETFTKIIGFYFAIYKSVKEENGFWSYLWQWHVRIQSSVKHVRRRFL